MGWDERQIAMLAEMGVRHWAAPPPRELDASPVAGDTRSPATDGPPARSDARVAAIAADPRSAEGRAAAIARLDWLPLSEAVAGCTACGLSESRRRTVFGVGHARARCMVVGEAPGEQEDREGEPFVGKAGQLLDRMLHAIDLARGPSAPGARLDAEARGEVGADVSSDVSGEADPARQVYIANVLKCRPPGNRNPALDEIAACEPFLRRQVALVRPRVILAMGRFAVTSLLASDAPIGKLRGRVHAFEGVPTVVTYHPAYLLRNPADKARAWDDLCLVHELLRGDGLAPPATG